MARYDKSSHHSHADSVAPRLGTREALAAQLDVISDGWGQGSSLLVVLSHHREIITTSLQYYWWLLHDIVMISLHSQ